MEVWRLVAVCEVCNHAVWRCYPHTAHKVVVAALVRRVSAAVWAAWTPPSACVPPPNLVKLLEVLVGGATPRHPLLVTQRWYRGWISPIFPLWRCRANRAPEGRKRF